jgi:hypothetical protein
MRIATAIALTAVLVAVNGCSMGGTKSSGTKSFDCSGSNIGWDACDKQAADACEKGYTVVKRNIDSTTGTAGPSQMKRELIVSCK